jgi:hypothetical protein
MTPSCFDCQQHSSLPVGMSVALDSSHCSRHVDLQVSVGKVIGAYFEHLNLSPVEWFCLYTIHRVSIIAYANTSFQAQMWGVKGNLQCTS